uniref:Taste receptor type 2 n=1 Tax=Pyxicephalus adspersus TaxID=30357 RepID=A0AAV3AE23_PYXAD|nr:TPA: hypothetical protein GDO54_009884 [Pyxicephalus adspersus]
MADSTEEAFYGIYLLFLTSLYGLATLAGFLVQSFIVAVNVIDWLKQKSIGAVDKMITFLGISRIFFHTAVLLYSISKLYNIRIPEIVITLNQFIMNISNLASIWLASLLSIFFYVKISTFHNAFFLHVKAIILKRVTYLIIGSVLLSLGYTFIYFMALPDNSFWNGTQDDISYNREKKILMYGNILCNSFPVLLFLIASLLQVILLVFHMRRMNNGGKVTSSTDTYHRIMKFTVLSFMVCAFYTLVNLFQMLIKLINLNWFLFTLSIFQALHSVLLIYVTMKLRNQFFRVVHCRTDRLFNRKALGPHPIQRVEMTP